MNEGQLNPHLAVPVNPPSFSPPSNVKRKDSVPEQSSAVCRVCLSSDANPEGEAALSALGICPPNPSENVSTKNNIVPEVVRKATSYLSVTVSDTYYRGTGLVHPNGVDIVSIEPDIVTCISSETNGVETFLIDPSGADSTSTKPNNVDNTTSTRPPRQCTEFEEISRLVDACLSDGHSRGGEPSPEDNSGSDSDSGGALGSNAANQSSLIALGCACRSEIAMAHYSCALRWFVLRGEPVCEVCGHVAETLRTDDLSTVLAALEERRRGILLGELLSPQFSIREGEGDSLAEYPLADSHRSPANQSTEPRNFGDIGQRRSNEGHDHIQGDQSSSPVAETETETETATGASPVGNSSGQEWGLEGGRSASPSRDDRVAVALKEHKALLDAIAWFDLQHGEDSFDQTILSPLFRSPFRGSSWRSEGARICPSGTCQFIEGFVTIVMVVPLAFGFALLFNLVLPRGFSNVGVNYVIGGIVAVVLIILFRLVVVPFILSRC